VSGWPAHGEDRGIQLPSLLLQGPELRLIDFSGDRFVEEPLQQAVLFLLEIRLEPVQSLQLFIPVPLLIGV